ncbi:MAG: NAD(P)-dependent oxidoreductase [Pseudomonadota bacterium]|nr:NAD(P)-dependent oxidoreductase [Pseudomonadota bacterium]
MSRTAVIFGGCGFIGTHLTRSLSTGGKHDRIILADIREPRERVHRAEYARCDVRAPIELAVCGDVDIYNLAAVHTTPGHADAEYYDTNIGGAINVCRFATSIGARFIVFTSSMSIYGPREEQLDEQSVPKPVNAYGKSKLLAEKIHEDWQGRDPANRLTIVRPAVIFGEGEHGNFSRLARLLRARRFVYPARTDTVKACGPVEELPRSLAFMSTFDEPVVRYIYAYPERTTMDSINRSFHEAAGFAMPRLVAPRWLIMTAAALFEGLNAIGFRNSVNRTRIRKLMESTNVYPGELLKRGWKFEHGLTAALKRWKVASNFE